METPEIEVSRARKELVIFGFDLTASSKLEPEATAKLEALAALTAASSFANEKGRLTAALEHLKRSDLDFRNASTERFPF